MPPRKRQPLDPVKLYWAHSYDQDHKKVLKKRKFYNNFPGDENCCRIISIDPGSVNMAIRIEEWYTSGWIIPIYYDKWSLRKKGIGSKTKVDTIRRNLTDKFDSIKNIILLADIVIIERQLKKNYECTRIMESIITYFIFTLKDKGNFPLIYDIDSKLKGNVLGYKKGEDLKKWSVIEAKKLLKQRKDQWSYNIIDQAKKSDDFADVVCQVEAFFRISEPSISTRKMNSKDMDNYPDSEFPKISYKIKIK